MATISTVLITGGSGLVGGRLTRLLQERGYAVTHLSRSAGKRGNVTTYRWDVEQGEIDPEAIRTADYIVHLAGAGIADKRWTASRKKEIMDSRVQSAALLAKALREQPHQVKAFVGASAIGYYGSKGDEWLTEDMGPGHGFMEEVCVAWEKASEEVTNLGIRTAILRIGLVLAKEGGALPQVVMPMRWGLGAWFGSGQQFYSWIHIDDLCRMFLLAIEQEINGVYNAVGPDPMRNKEFTREVKKGLRSSALLLPAPIFGLRLVLGQMADVVLYSARVSSSKIQSLGFQFQYHSVSEAVAAIYGKK